MSEYAPFEVIKLASFDDLSRILYPQDYSLLTSEENSHCWYLWHYYLGDNGLSAKFAVIEKNYISRDYLDSYRDYYASCFSPIERNCQRIHFFKNVCDINAFKRLLDNAILSSGDEVALFWQKDYLGFIVIKPIPQFSIGFTALKHYNYDTESSLYKKSRSFWGVREYDFNIFGRKISFETLPFQEQDTNLAACASVAIWVMLQIPSATNLISLKSPGQITNDADLIANDGNRLFPNDGLVVNQMCTAITKSGLVTEYEEIGYYKKVHTNSGLKDEYVFNDIWLKLLVRAYSPLQIPLILCVGVPEKDHESNVSFDGHAVAICGHEEHEDPDYQTLSDDDGETIFFAKKIKKLYVHDDDFGPFARMEFRDDGLSSAWGTNLETGVYDKTMPCRPESLIISLYPEIRVRYSTVHSVVLILDFTFGLSSDPAPALEWDIRIQQHAKWKQEFKTTAKDTLSDNYKLKVLTTQLPKYVWVATCRKEGQVVYEVLFDTTAMRNSMLALNMVFYDDGFEGLISQLVTENYEILSEYMGYDKQYLLFLKKFFESNEKSPFWHSKTIQGKQKS